MRLRGFSLNLRANIGYAASPALMSLMARQAEVWTREPNEVLEFFGLDQAEAVDSEFQKLNESLSQGELGVWPEFFDLGEGSRRLLYSLVRAIQPRTMLETGVANGVSSYFVLSAMDANEKGHLHSVDMTRNVGQVFGGSHTRWTLHVTHGRGRDLSVVARQLQNLDLFFHDADHSYPSQLNEYSIAASKMAAGSWIVSDDVDSSWAFRDFCKKNDLPMVILQDTNKLFGVTRL